MLGTSTNNIIRENTVICNTGIGIADAALLQNQIVNNFSFSNVGGNYVNVDESCQGIAPKPIVVDTLSKVCELRELACTNLIRQSDMNTTFTIDQPGLYCLTEDVQFGAGTFGIHIISDCVTLDLNSHSITDTTAGGGTAIQVGGNSNVTIRNGLIKSNCVPPGDGIVLDSTSTCVSIHDIKVVNVSNDAFIIAGSGHSLSNCVARSTGGNGFFVTGGASTFGITFDNCTTVEASTNGFATGSNTSNVCFTNCISIRSGDDGFEIDGSDNVLRECISKDASGVGFVISQSQASFNLVQNCIAITGASDGFLIQGPDTLIDCVAEHNAGDGIRLSSLQTSGVILKENHCHHNGGLGINVTTEPGGVGHEIVNNFAHDNTGGDFSTFVPVDCQGIAPKAVIEVLCTNWIRQRDMDTTFTIDTPGLYCLAEDVEFGAGAIGICIATDCVTLDLNSHSITDTTVAGGTAVLVGGHSNVTIRNGLIKSNCVPPVVAEGIVLDSTSTCVSIHDIKVVDMSGNAFTIAGSGHSLSNCVARSAVVHGFRVASFATTFGITFDHCTAVEAGADGFSIGSGTSNVCLTNCISIRSGDDGFQIASSNHLLRDCVSKDAGSNGFEIASAGTFVVMQNCVATGGTSDGFFIDGNDNVLLECTAENNAGDGIEVAPSLNGVVLKENFCFHNTGFGILVGTPSGVGHEVVNNFAHDNAGGNFSMFVPVDCQGIAPKAVIEVLCTNWIRQRDMDTTFTIDTPGLYCLAEDVEFGAGAFGIHILSDCVTLDLNSHTITATVANGGTAIQVDGSANITVRNGLIKSNCVPPTNGLVLASTTTCVSVHDIKIVGMSGSAFSIAGSGHSLSNCIARSTGGNGFLVTGGANTFGVIFNHCTSAAGNTDAFSIGSMTSNICLADCIALNSSDDGFLIAGTSHLLRDCIVKDANGDGFEILSTGSLILMQNCVATDGTGNGFVIRSNDNVLLECIAESNAGDGIEVSSGVTNGIVLKENQCHHNGGLGINVAVMPTGVGHEIVNNFAHNNTGGNFSTFVPVDCQGIAPKAVIEVLCTNWIRQRDMDTTFVINTPGLYCLAEDVQFGEDAIGISITTDCVTLDLNSHSITDTTAGGGTAINVGGNSNITIRNGLIKGNATSSSNGISLDATSTCVSIHDIKVAGATGDAFNIRGSGHSVSKCVARSAGTGFCVGGGGSTFGIVFENCSAVEASGDGFSTGMNTSNVCFINCVAIRNGGDGFEIDGSDHVLRECISKDAGQVGFDISTIGASFNVAQNCIAITSASHGFFVRGTDVLIDCIAEHNTEDGIRIASVTSGVILQKNHCHHNTGFGINVTASPTGIGHEIINNFAHDNTAGDYSGDVDASCQEIAPKPIVVETLSKVCDIQTRVEDIDTKVDHLFDLGMCPNLIRASDFGPSLSISSPGRYCFVDDVTFSTMLSTAVAITASNVFIDMNNHTLTVSNNNSTGFANSGAASDVTIANGTITGGTGVSLTAGALGWQIRDMEMLDMATGVNTDSVEGVRIEHCKITGPGDGSSQAILAIGSGDIVVKDCIISGHTDATPADGAIEFDGTSTSCILSCILNDNAGTSIALGNCSDCNLIDNCLIKGNRGVGVRINDSFLNVVRNCSIDCNRAIGVEFVATATSNLIRDNDVTGNSGVAIDDIAVNQNVILRNVAMANNSGGANYSSVAATIITGPATVSTAGAFDNFSDNGS